MADPVSTVLDYTGRTVDLLMLTRAATQQDLSGSGMGSLYDQTLVSGNGCGAIIAGIEKLAQRFLLELFTDLGSIPQLPYRGCLFMLQAKAGLWRTTADVSSSFYQALLLVKRNLIQEEADTDPDDERFATADIISVAMTADSVMLQLSVTSRAGKTRLVLYPIRYLV